MQITQGFLPVVHALGWTLSSMTGVACAALSCAMNPPQNAMPCILRAFASAFSFVLSASSRHCRAGSAPHSSQSSSTPQVIRILADLNLGEQNAMKRGDSAEQCS